MKDRISAPSRYPERHAGRSRPLLGAPTYATNCARTGSCHTSRVTTPSVWNRWLQRLGIIGLLSMPASVSASTVPTLLEEDAADAAIDIRVTNVRSADGYVLLLLFNTADGFPNVSTKAINSARIRATKGRVTHEIRGLAPGRYAVTVIHDENNNKKLDTNLFGIPKEGWGTSRNPRPRTRAPRWSESSFALKTGSTRDVAISLVYR